MADPLLPLVQRHTSRGGAHSPFATAIPGLWLLRSDQPRQATPRLFQPSLCVTVQSLKSSIFGNRRYTYAPGQALMVSVASPASSQIVQASPGEPYLGLALELEPDWMYEVVEARSPAHAQRDDLTHPHGAFVTALAAPLQQALQRLLQLLDTPTAIDYLAPLIKREIGWWILDNPQGAALARLLLGPTHPPRIVQAIHQLRSHFTEPLTIGALAATAQMSPSTFHRQFKALTAMSPLQYQKQLRLLEARRLMLGNAVNAEAAAFQVGYESPSQFSREYTRLFGAPPRKDVAALVARG